jgi:hypothetical protein
VVLLSFQYTPLALMPAGVAGMLPGPPPGDTAADNVMTGDDAPEPLVSSDRCDNGGG